MATRLYSIKPQDAAYQVTEAAGSATTTSAIEVTVDFTALAALSGAGKNLVLDGLTKIAEYIEQTGKWPPA